ncbi:MAG: hypothetical protein L6U16_03570 [Porphyromonadaceae bacterium]|nr:MAG: hypothetical protein L6U16_03570 [Porphyromonadaceae bacterium]
MDEIGVFGNIFVKDYLCEKNIYKDLILRKFVDREKDKNSIFAALDRGM